MLASLRQLPPVRLAIFILLALTLYRFWFATRLELIPDEAYYWLWAKHPALSYRDKGPLIAWTIAVGTWLFGDTVFGIRFFAVVLSTGIAGLLFLLARRLYDDRVALWCLVTASVIPLVAVGSLLMTIDSLSLFFWAWAAILFWNALHSGRDRDWFWLGLLIGAGFLAKFTNGVQVGCIGLFLLWSKEHRPLLWSRKMWVMGAAFLVSIAPLLWWNVQTGWIHFIALRSRSGAESSFQIRPGQLLGFIGAQFGVMSPLLMAGMIVAAVALLWKRHTDMRMRFLLSQFLPVYGIFLFFSLNKSGEANWTAPALVTGVIFTVVFWRELVARRPAWRWGIGAALAIASLMTVVLHDTSYLHLPPAKDPLRRAQGWADFAVHIQAAREKHQAKVLIAHHYYLASMMTFYLPDRPVTYLPPEPYGSTQFSLWSGYEVRPDTHAPFVAYAEALRPKALQEQFNRIELVDDFWSLHHGRPMTQFRLYICSRQ